VATTVQLLQQNQPALEANSLVNVRQTNPDLLNVLNDPFMFTHRKVVVEAANQMHVPAVYGFREFVDDGGLISYGVSIADTYRRAALLRGAKPADLPVELTNQV
jgi:ABC-type uncharacterized transport system substrate-binding protein